jgi:diphthamide biosynthesis protein 4
MAYTKDYYHILNIPALGWTGSTSPLSTADLRRAYKIALLAAHPDKKTQQKEGTYTVDDVKEAYTVLVDGKKKADYDNWLLHNRDSIQRAAGGMGAQAPSTDFILGLELLDLSDFDVLDPDFSFHTPSAAEIVEAAKRGEKVGGFGGNHGGNHGEGEDEQMEWTRACRCGDEKGYRILEEELEDAERRGEKEVLVGCEGCSLWVRVGFEVEEG